MRFSRVIGFLVFAAGFTACKSVNHSELTATPEEREHFKACIVSTVLESYANTKPDIKAVNAFADDLVRRAPKGNSKTADAEFENYAENMGCDANKVGKTSNLGNTIVAEWAISPYNPALPKDPAQK